MVNEFLIVVTMTCPSVINEGKMYVRKNEYKYSDYGKALLAYQEKLSEAHNDDECSQLTDFVDNSHEDIIASPEQKSDEDIKNDKILELDKDRDTTPDNEKFSVGYL